MEKLAERLKELRLEKGLTLLELAKQTGLSKSALSYWEIEKRIPNASAIIILAAFYNVSTDYLLGVID